jgi:hypothetical protein
MKVWWTRGSQMEPVDELDEAPRLFTAGDLTMVTAAAR